MPCDASQAEFVDNQAPSYSILAKDDEAARDPGQRVVGEPSIRPPAWDAFVTRAARQLGRERRLRRGARGGVPRPLSR